jgi:hypothetical protein
MIKGILGSLTEQRLSTVIPLSSIWGFDNGFVAKESIQCYQVTIRASQGWTKEVEYLMESKSNVNNIFL